LYGAVTLAGSKTVVTDATTMPVQVAGNIDLESSAKVKISGSTAVDIPTGAGVGPDSGTSAAPSSNLAVIRTGDSLELRNVTVSGFSQTRLEKVDPTTRALQGRVLISGSAVRDFRIKALVGAAVNADAKIQMAALDGNNQLNGTMTVEGQLPVATQLAGALASVQGKPLADNDASASTPVHADMVDLAAKNITFNNASISAMNSITARANTIVVQNSFMTVVRNSGMINMYVQSGLVNRNYGSEVAGRLNFAGLSNFRIGNLVNFSIANSSDIARAMSAGQLQEVSIPQSGKVNVLKL
jgi:hypothetical protein